MLDVIPIDTVRLWGFSSNRQFALDQQIFEFSFFQLLHVAGAEVAVEFGFLFFPPSQFESVNKLFLAGHALEL